MGIKNFLTQIKNEDWVSEILDQQLFRESNLVDPLHPSTPILSIRPSSSSSACVRNIQLSMLGFREKMLPQNLRRTRNGSAAHERWNEEFKKSNILVAANVKLKVPDIQWSGECDVIIKNPQTNINHILEIKTMNAMRYRKVPEQIKDLQEMANIMVRAEKPYMYQLAQYIHIFKDTEYTTSNVGMFLFENTDTQEFKIRYVQPSPSLITEVFSLPLLAQENLRNGILVEPPFARMSATCRKCYKETVCYKIQDNNQETIIALNEAIEQVRIN